MDCSFCLVLYLSIFEILILSLAVDVAEIVGTVFGVIGFVVITLRATGGTASLIRLATIILLANVRVSVLYPGCRNTIGNLEFFYSFSRCRSVGSGRCYVGKKSKTSKKFLKVIYI